MTKKPYATPAVNGVASNTITRTLHKSLPYPAQLDATPEAVTDHLHRAFNLVIQSSQTLRRDGICSKLKAEIEAAQSALECAAWATSYVLEKEGER